MRSLKIAIIAHLKYSLKEPFVGGLEAFTYNLAIHLIKRGHQVTVFCARGSERAINPSYIAPPTQNSDLREIIPPYEIAENEDVQYVEYQSYSCLMQQLRQADFDIIHNNSLHAVVCSFSNILPTPMLTTLHTPPLAWLVGAINCAQRQNNHLITISNYMRQLWQEAIGDTEVIYNGVDLTKYQSDSSLAKLDHAFWFGRITPEKGTKYAIEAAQLANIKLRLAGAIYDQTYFENEIAPLLNENITYLGHLNQIELCQEMSRAKLSVCTPCWDEPYGLVVAEALSCGLPVAAFDRGAIKEILDEKTGTLARPNDAASLANAIKKALLLDGKDCLARAKNIASIETMLDAYERRYYQLLERHS